jgi:ectoine hydroxylase
MQAILDGDHPLRHPGNARRVRHSQRRQRLCPEDTHKPDVEGAYSVGIVVGDVGQRPPHRSSRAASEHLVARPTSGQLIERHIAMRLSANQMEQFDRNGYLFFPGLFTPTETCNLAAAVPELYRRHEAYNVREKGKDAVRTNFAAHLYNEPFARLARHPRMVEPVQDLLGEKLYMHQFKINGKAAFDGDVWQWHQDYGTWKNDDLMPAERAMNVAIFLDEVSEFNGPLMFIPGSHKRGVIDATHDLTTTSYPLWTIDNALIAQLVERAGGKRGGLVAPKGPAGSMILFHGCLVHASGSNLSPFDRVSVYLSLCAVSNHIRRFKRPEYIAHRDFTPIETLPDDCLLENYPVDLPWKNGMPASALETSTDELAFVAEEASE